MSPEIILRRHILTVDRTAAAADLGPLLRLLLAISARRASAARASAPPAAAQGGAPPETKRPRSSDQLPGA
jgi:hypothetical protein